MGILGSLFDTNDVKPPNIEKFKAEAEAKAAKALYDAFITQAFELTKTTIENN